MHQGCCAPNEGLVTLTPPSNNTNPPSPLATHPHPHPPPPPPPWQEAELHQAWDLYYHVFKRINKQLPSLTTLELQYVAPALVRAQVRSPAEWGHAGPGGL